MSETTHPVLEFESDAPAFSGLVCHVTRAHIEERLSRLYRLEVFFDIAHELPLASEDVVEVLAHRARLRISAGGPERVVHGQVSELELRGPNRDATFSYRAVLEPRLARARLTRRSRLFHDLSYPAIVRRVLLEFGWLEEHDFELRLGDELSNYPTRDYTVQYEESDLAFVQRLLERAGLGFTFEPGEDRERFVVFDRNAALEDLGALPFDARHAHDHIGHVTAMRRAQRPFIGEVVVTDYHDETPEVPIRGEATAGEGLGEGRAHYHRLHCETLDAASYAALVRAERHAARREVYSGEANAVELRAGTRFALEHAYCGDLEQPYLIVGLTLEARREVDGDSGLEVRFEAIPATTPWRPEVETPWPSVRGLMSARVAGPAPGPGVAPLDDAGRYRVRFPWDIEGGEESTSRWVRMAEPQTGEGYGVHFPLQVGTEVLLDHIGGDPDQPVIVGAVPNPSTTSPVTRENAVQNVLRSRTGVLIELDDAPD